MTPAPYTEKEQFTPNEEPTQNIDGDYTVPYTDLQIYKMYNTTTGYSSTSNANIYVKMDASYGMLFDSNTLGKMSDENIEKLWNSNESVTIDDAIYNACNYFAIQSSVRKCAYSNNTGLSSYFSKQVQNNKSKSSVLLSLKNAYYAIIKPRFLMNTLSNIYWQNAKSFTNSDKGTYNSILFVLNTCSSLANTNTIETDLSENNVANIIGTNMSFTVDSIWLYQMSSIAFELYRFTAYFGINGAETSGNGTPAIKTKIDTFLSGHPAYLKKTSQVSYESPLVFVLQNLPNDDECKVVSKLLPHINKVLH